MSYDVEKKHHKGFAFVEYATAEAAALALKKLKGVTLNDRRMKLGRPQAALRYQTLLAQLEMDGRASARVYLANLPKEASLEKVFFLDFGFQKHDFFHSSDPEKQAHQLTF